MTATSPRDLVLAALRHEETDQVPRNFMLSPPALRKLQEYLGTPDVEPFLGSCVYVYGCSDKPLYAHPDKYGPTITDPYGVVWATSTIDRGYPVGHPLTAPTLDGYEFPNPLLPYRWERVPQVAAAQPECFRLAVVGDLWERANFLRGLGDLLLDLREHPAFVHELLDRICEYNLATLEGMVPHAPDGVFLSDDYGLQRSLMMSPADWRTFIRPRLARLLGAAQAHGLATMIHSCGCVTEIIPDLIELGLDILHPIQPEAMDLAFLKREYGRDLTFCGGFNTQQLLPHGTPAEIRAEAFRLAEELGRGGGYILEPGITVQDDVPVENLVALVEAAREYRRGGTTRPNPGPRRFVGEPITPDVGAMDPHVMAMGEPDVPRVFQWGDRRCEVSEVLSVWKDVSDKKHGGEPGYVRKHWFRLRLADGAVAEVYFLRQPQGPGKHRWYLYTLTD